MSRLNFGPRLKEFAYRPLELDARINILEGSVRAGKTWALIPKILYACRYPVNGWRIMTGQSKQTIFRNVLADLFNLIGPRHYSYNQQSGLLRQMCIRDRLKRIRVLALDGHITMSGELALARELSVRLARPSNHRRGSSVLRFSMASTSCKYRSR